MLRILKPLLAVVVLLCIACDNSLDNITRFDSGGTALITVQMNKSTAKVTSDPGDVAKVTLNVTWTGGGAPPIDMTPLGNGGFAIEVGNLPVDEAIGIEASAYADNDQLLFVGGVANVVLAGGQTTNIPITLFPFDGGNGQMLAPRILAVHKPLFPVTAGNIFPIEFEVGSPWASALSFTIQTSTGHVSVNSGQVTLVNGVGSIATTFYAPSIAATAEIVVSIEDPDGLSASQSTAIVVLPVPLAGEDLGGALPSLNFSPGVIGITASSDDSGASIRLTATVTDDGPLNELTYLWLSNGQAIGDSNPVDHESNTGLAKIGLTVSDAGGGQTTVEFQLDTTTAELLDLPITNQPPTIAVALLSNQNVMYGDVVTATLYATDLEGAALSATWSTNWGSILSTESTNDGVYTIKKARWTGGTTAGSAQLEALISDPLGGAIRYRFTIHQVLGQIPITAAAGPDGAAFIGGPFVLDGSASTSGDGQITSYLWEQISGPASTIQAPSSVTTSVTPTIVGTYTYRLSVTNLNNSASDTIAIAVTDPMAFSFVDADADQNGVIYFLDTTSRLVRRYDTTAQKWLSSMPTADAVKVLAVAPEGNAVYVGYEGGRMDVFNPTTTARTLFANNPATVTRMYVTGQYLYTQDPTGAWATRSLYSRSTGIRTYSAEWTYTSNGFQFSPILNRLFHFRDGTSPNDIIYQVVDQTTGVLGAQVDSPYHGGYTFTHPIRLFPNHTRVVVASGVIFSTNDLTVAGGLGLSYVDLQFHGNRPVIIRASGSQTEMLLLNEDFTPASSQLITGTPQRVFVRGGTSFVFTQQSVGQLRLTKVVLP